MIIEGILKVVILVHAGVVIVMMVSQPDRVILIYVPMLGD